MEKMDFLLTYQINNMKPTLSIQSSCRKTHHWSLLSKIDFIEKTCPNHHQPLLRKYAQ